MTYASRPPYHTGPLGMERPASRHPASPGGPRTGWCSRPRPATLDTSDGDDPTVIALPLASTAPTDPSWSVVLDRGTHPSDPAWGALDAGTDVVIRPHWMRTAGTCGCGASMERHILGLGPSPSKGPTLTATPHASVCPDRSSRSSMTMPPEVVPDPSIRFEWPDLGEWCPVRDLGIDIHDRDPQIPYSQWFRRCTTCTRRSRRRWHHGSALLGHMVLDLRRQPESSRAGWMPRPG